MNDFAPNPGKITGYRSPGGHGVRVDSGVYMNYAIPPFYDSMISKLIVLGRTRNEAIARMKRALSEYIILGVKTTIPFHKAMMANEHFQRQSFTPTSWMNTNRKSLKTLEKLSRLIKRWKTGSNQHFYPQRRLQQCPRLFQVT